MVTQQFHFKQYLMYCKVFYRLMPVLISSNKETTFLPYYLETEILFSTFHSSNFSGSCNEWFKNNQFNSSLSKVNNCRKKNISVEKVVKSNRFERFDLAAGFTLWEIKDVKCDVICPSFLCHLFVFCPSFVHHLYAICPSFVRHLSVICPSYACLLFVICLYFVHHLSFFCPSFVRQCPNDIVYQLSIICKPFVRHLSIICPSFARLLSVICPSFAHLLSVICPSLVCLLSDNVRMILSIICPSFVWQNPKDICLSIVRQCPKDICPSFVRYVDDNCSKDISPKDFCSNPTNLY
jgi:hypothetical protein